MVPSGGKNDEKKHRATETKKSVGLVWILNKTRSLRLEDSSRISHI